MRKFAVSFCMIVRILLTRNLLKPILERPYINYETKRTNRQKLNQSTQTYDQTCGFWCIAEALSLSLQFSSPLPHKALRIKYLLVALLQDFCNVDKGGLTKRVFIDTLHPFLDPLLTEKLSSSHHILVSISSTCSCYTSDLALSGCTARYQYEPHWLMAFACQGRHASKTRSNFSVSLAPRREQSSSLKPQSSWYRARVHT
jgi:hypothetical protein